MIPVEQRRLWRPEHHPDGPQRGDCGAACIASIFELPYEGCAGIDGTSDAIATWTSARHPGVVASHVMLGDNWRQRERVGDHVKWPTTHHERGFWMATIWSPRIPDVEMFGCGCPDHTDDGLPDPTCRWCGGEPHSRSMGITWGLHAVVMENARLAWDPHPSRDPDAVLYLRGATTWRVTNPALLTGARA